MKIAMFAYSFAPHWGGAEIQAVRLSAALESLGHQTVHVCAGEVLSLTRETFDGLDVVRLPGFAQGAARRAAVWLKYWPALRRWLRTEGRSFDVFHVHGAFDPSSLAVCRASARLGRPVVLKHAGIGEYARLWKTTRVPEWMAKRIHAGAAAHVTNNPDVLQGLREVPAFRGAITEHIPNGTPLPEPSSPEARAEARRNFELPDDAVVFVNVSNFHDAGKNHELLLRAWAEHLSARPQARLLLAGDGRNLQTVKALAAQLGVEAQVGFLGRVDDVASLLTAADAFVFPSVVEGMSNALLEAMANRLPVIAADLPSSTSVFRPPDEGLVFDPARPNLGELLLGLLDSSELRARLGHAARRRVEAEFSMAHIAGRYVELYRRAVEAIATRQP